MTTFKYVVWQRGKWATELIKSIKKFLPDDFVPFNATSWSLIKYLLFTHTFDTIGGENGISKTLVSVIGLRFGMCYCI